MKAASATTKHQHWVPQFYLRYFATPDTREAAMPKIWLFDKKQPDLERAPTAVRNVCGKRYLYTPLDESGNRDTSLDKYLDELEAETAALWPVLARDCADLSEPALRNRLARFTAYLHLRNFELFRLIDSTLNLRNKLYGVPSEELLASRSAGMPDLKDAGRFFVHTVRNGADRITKTFAEMRWTMVCSGVDVFATSDRPVTFLHETLKMPGPGKQGSVALIPLTPRRLLAMDDRHDQPANFYRNLDGDSRASPFNAAIFDKAVRFVIGSKRLTDVLKRKN